MNMIRLIFALSIAAILSACGGGGSSSSGGSNQFAGVYSGTHTVTFNLNGSTSTDQIFLTLTVNGDGSYRITDGDGGAGSISAVGTLDGNKFRATGTERDTIDGITCDLTATYAGNIVNDAAKGTTSGNGRCSASGVNVNVSFSGDFDLPKTGNAKQPKSSSLIDAMSRML